jgi:hypothetical protein
MSGVRGTSVEVWAHPKSTPINASIHTDVLRKRLKLSILHLEKV